MPRRVLVTARRLSELGVTADEIPEQKPIELAPRRPQAAELLAEEQITTSDSPHPAARI
ncbi:hypothetical protein GCM10009661_06380 [Catellatospora chokoriensis]|uniref:Uncharacterized protein n=1 Tax=Catellatospora chokoriensis TaxID=310353 RepID=A0A8J3JWY9_9ACTN|nr:hypothetical protein Cch02nite_18160 [Catellatospora chokoriensis]